MASKYAQVMAGLPKLLGTEPEYQQKVDAIKEQLLSMEFTPPTREDLDARVNNLTSDLGCLLDMVITVAGGKRHGVALTRAFVEARRVKDALEKAEKDVEVIIAALTQLACEQFEVEGTSSIRLDTNDSVTNQPEPYAQVVDRDLFREWCIKNGLERSLMLPWQTTNALTKARLLEGESEPDGVKCFVKDKLVWRRG